MPNNPLTDVALAELDRLRSKCQPGQWRFSEYLDVFRIELSDAYPALRQRLADSEARLAEAEREQQRLHDLANRLLDANNGLIGTIRRLDPEALCDWHDSIGGDEYLQEWLAARDAQQRREGAAEWLEKAAREGGYYERSSEGMLEEAKQLREEK